MNNSTVSFAAKADAEATYLRVIELEQALYEKNADNLRTLNHEIEVLKVPSWMKILHKNQLSFFCFSNQIVDESRVPMQDQFESWYAGMQARNCSTQILSVFN